MPTFMDFSQALAELKKGARVAREGWNGKGMYIEMQTPTDLSKMKKPYLYICCIDGEFVPWLASQTDLLTEDWHFVE